MYGHDYGWCTNIDCKKEMRSFFWRLTNQRRRGCRTRPYDFLWAPNCYFATVPRIIVLNCYNYNTLLFLIFQYFFSKGVGFIFIFAHLNLRNESCSCRCHRNGWEIMQSILEERNFPITEFLPVASARSIGKTICFQGKDYTVIGLDEAVERVPDLRCFLLGANFSRLGTKFAAVGTTVIDNSSAWRMHRSKLIVPEINADQLTLWQNHC